MGPTPQLMGPTPHLWVPEVHLWVPPHSYGSHPTLMGSRGPLMGPIPHLWVPEVHFWVPLHTYGSQRSTYGSHPPTYGSQRSTYGSHPTLMGPTPHLWVPEVHLWVPPHSYGSQPPTYGTHPTLLGPTPLLTHSPTAKTHRKYPPTTPKSQGSTVTAIVGLPHSSAPQLCPTTDIGQRGEGGVGAPPPYWERFSAPQLRGAVWGHGGICGATRCPIGTHCDP